MATPASPDQSPRGPAATTDGLEAVLGPFDVTMIVMGSIVGSGIFFAPAHVAAQAGTLGGILVVWALGGAFALAGAIVFAELGALLPRAGGQYVFLREAFGPFVAFLFGWALLTVILSPAMAFVAGVFAKHLEELFVAAVGGPFPPAASRAVAVASIVGLGWLNARGLRLGARVQNLAMLAKAGGILFIVALGAGVALGWLEAGAPDTLATGAPASGGSRGLGALAAALVGVVFSYGGWQNVTAVASEVVRPERTLPLGILLGTGLVVGLYLALNAALVALLGVEGLAASATPVASAARAVTPIGGALVAGMIALSAFAILQALLMVAPRILYAMARDGSFFRAAGAVHPRWRTPWVAIALLSAAGVVHVFVAEGLGELLELTAQADTVFFCLSGVALFVFRRRMPDAPRAYRAHGYPLVPLAFTLFSGAMVVNVAVSCELAVVSKVAGLLAAGGVLYVFWRRR